MTNPYRYNNSCIKEKEAFRRLVAQLVALISLYGKIVNEISLPSGLQSNKKCITNPIKVVK